MLGHFGGLFGPFVLVHEGKTTKQAHMREGLSFALWIMAIYRLFSEISPGNDLRPVL